MFGIWPDEEYRRNGDFVVEGDSKDINDLRVARVPELDDEWQVKKPGRLQPLSEYAQRMYESDGHNDREVAGYRLEWHDDDTLHLVSPRNAVYTYNPDANGGGDFEQVNSEV